MSFPLSQRPTYRAEKSKFHGIDVVVAFRQGEAQPFAVEADSIKNALGHEHTDSSRALVAYHMTPAVLVVGGEHRTGAVVPFRPFFAFCMQHPSPRLEAFREHLSEIAVNVQNTGGHIEPGASAEAYIPPELKGTQIGGLLAVITNQAVMQQRLEQEQAKQGREIAGIKEHLGQGPSSWTVAAWLSLQGRKLITDAVKNEGGRLGRICQARGYAVPPDKVCNGSDFPARRWPMEAIREWWPECCRRYGWDVTWRSS